MVSTVATSSEESPLYFPTPTSHPRSIPLHFPIRLISVPVFREASMTLFLENLTGSGALSFAIMLTDLIFRQ